MGVLSGYYVSHAAPGIYLIKLMLGVFSEKFCVVRPQRKSYALTCPKSLPGQSPYLGFCLSFEIYFWISAKLFVLSASICASVRIMRSLLGIAHEKSIVERNLGPKKPT